MNIDVLKNDSLRFFISVFTGIWAAYVLICIIYYDIVIEDTLTILCAMTGCIILIIHIVVIGWMMSHKEKKE